MNWKVKGGKFVNGDKTITFVDADEIAHLFLDSTKDEDSCLSKPKEYYWMKHRKRQRENSP